MKFERYGCCDIYASLSITTVPVMTLLGDADGSNRITPRLVHAVVVLSRADPEPVPVPFNHMLLLMLDPSAIIVDALIILAAVYVLAINSAMNGPLSDTASFGPLTKSNQNAPGFLLFCAMGVVLNPPLAVFVKIPVVSNSSEIAFGVNTPFGNHSISTFGELVWVHTK